MPVWIDRASISLTDYEAATLALAADDITWEKLALYIGEEGNPPSRAIREHGNVECEDMGALISALLILNAFTEDGYIEGHYYSESECIDIDFRYEFARAYAPVRAWWKYEPTTTWNPSHPLSKEDW